MRTVKALLLGLFIILLILFVVQNLSALSHAESLRLNLYLLSYTTPPMSLSLLLPGCFALGFLTAYALGFVDRRKLKKNIRSLENLRGRTETELNSLRNLPITGDTGTPENGRNGGKSM